MDIPKILWLKTHMPPDRFARCHFFDLPDYLTFRATGSLTRSSCSLTCKCSFIPHEGWQAEFFHAMGLDGVIDGAYVQIGGGGSDSEQTIPLTAGVPVGKGLSIEAASELGLVVGTPVGSALIDACVHFLVVFPPRIFHSDIRSIL